MEDEKANAVSLAELDRTYAEHKASFEKWKVENSRQLGTESYNQYVKQFMDWEKEVITRKKVLSNSLEPKPVSGPENVDSILGDLLDDVKPMEFLMALMTMQMKDVTFLPNVLANFQKVQNGQLETQPKLVVPTPQFNPAVAPPSVSFGYHSAVSVQPQPTVVHSTPSSVSGWGASQLPKAYRPPSPVRDYKNPTATMPFRDFSQ